MKYLGNRHCFSLSIQRECDREGPPQRGGVPPQEHPGEPRLQTQGLRRPDREEELRFWRAILQLWGHSAGKAKAAKEAAGEQREKYYLYLAPFSSTASVAKYRNHGDPAG